MVTVIVRKGSWNRVRKWGSTYGCHQLGCPTKTFLVLTELFSFFIAKGKMRRTRHTNIFASQEWNSCCFHALLWSWSVNNQAHFSWKVGTSFSHDYQTVIFKRKFGHVLLLPNWQAVLPIGGLWKQHLIRNLFIIEVLLTAFMLTFSFSERPRESGVMLDAHHWYILNPTK